MKWFIMLGLLTACSSVNEKGRRIPANFDKNQIKADEEMSNKSVNSLIEFSQKVTKMSKQERRNSYLANLGIYGASCGYGKAGTFTMGVVDMVPVASLIAQEVVFDDAEIDTPSDHESPTTGGFETAIDTGGAYLGVIRQLIESTFRYPSNYVYEVATGKKIDYSATDDFVEGMKRNFHSARAFAKNNLGNDSMCKQSQLRLLILKGFMGKKAGSRK